MSKLLVTGASGFIGSFVVDKALELGYSVFAAIRKSSSKEFLQDSRIKFIYIDFEDQIALENICSAHRFDYVVHCAGVTAAKNLDQFIKVNSGYTQNLVEALEKECPRLKKFIFLSSLASFGPADSKPDNIIKESHTPVPVTKYGESKLDAERYLAEKKNFPYVILRPTAVYGPREKDLLQVWTLVKKGMELYVGREKQKLSFIFIHDLIQIVFDLMNSEHRNKGYLVTDGNIYSGQEFNGYIKSNLKTKTLPLHLPIGIVKMIAIVSEGVSKITGKFPPLNLDKVNELKSKNWICDISPLEEDIGFKAKYDLKAGTEITTNWYLENKWI